MLSLAFSLPLFAFTRPSTCIQQWQRQQPHSDAADTFNESQVFCCCPTLNLNQFQPNRFTSMRTTSPSRPPAAPFISLPQPILARTLSLHINRLCLACHTTHATAVIIMSCARGTECNEFRNLSQFK